MTAFWPHAWLAFRFKRLQLVFCLLFVCLLVSPASSIQFLFRFKITLCLS